MDPVLLVDDDLMLLPPSTQDLEAVQCACADPEIGRWTSVPSPYRREDAERWIGAQVPAGWAEDRALTWLVRRVDDPDVLVGSVGLHHLDLASRCGEIGYWTAAPSRGQGLTTAAVALVCRWAFDTLGLERIEWEAAVGNHGSQRVAEKLGFTHEVTTRGGLVQHGVRRDSWRAGLLPGELLVRPSGPLRALAVGELHPATSDEAPTPADTASPGGAGSSGAPSTSSTSSTPGAEHDDWVPHGVEITAGSLHLRPFHDQDAEALLPLTADPEMTLWNPLGGGPRGRTPEQVVSDALADGAGAPVRHAAFAVTDATTGELLGGVTLHQLDRSTASGALGYWTLPTARRRGVATRAVGTAARFAFGALGLERLELCHALGNEASCHVALANGFTLEGTTRRSHRYGDGEPHDEHVHALLAADLG